jgi:hypothetical protein
MTWSPSTPEARGIARAHDAQARLSPRDRSSSATSHVRSAGDRAATKATYAVFVMVRVIQEEESSLSAWGGKHHLSLRLVIIS